MILHTRKHNKVKCVKTNRPKFESKTVEWDKINGSIDEDNTEFFYTLKNNGGYFYFVHDNQWYKTEICNKDGFDLWVWIFEEKEALYTMKSQKSFDNSKQFIDCLSCSNSFSEPCKDGDILHCMVKDEKIVRETDCCDKWN